MHATRFWSFLTLKGLKVKAVWRNTNVYEEGGDEDWMELQFQTALHGIRIE